MKGNYSFEIMMNTTTKKQQDSLRPCRSFCSTLLSFYSKSLTLTSRSHYVTEEIVLRAISYHLDNTDTHTIECDHYINYLLDSIVRSKCTPILSERMLAAKNIEQQIDQLNKTTDSLITLSVNGLNHITEEPMEASGLIIPFVSLKRELGEVDSPSRRDHHQHQQRKRRRLSPF